MYDLNCTYILSALCFKKRQLKLIILKLCTLYKIHKFSLKIKQFRNALEIFFFFLNNSGILLLNNFSNLEILLLRNVQKGSKKLHSKKKKMLRI